MKALNSINEKFGKFLDPLLVVAILALFIVPALTLANLTPGYRPVQEESNVLGITNETTMVIQPNTATFDGISLVKFTQTSETSHTIYLEQNPHKAGVHTSKLLTAMNGTEEEKEIHVTSSIERVTPGSKISLVIGNTKFIILDENGISYPPTIYVAPRQKMEIYIEIDSPVNVNFTSGLSLDLAVE